jgi:hypothetical protein
MRLFNSIQLVTLFACAPLIYEHVHEHPFFKWVFWVVYSILFVLNCVAVFMAVDKNA